MDDLVKLPWRVGTRVRRTIYAVLPGKEHDDHPLIGVMDTPQLAVEVVSAHNKMMNTTTFAEKERLVKDLEKTAQIWEKNNDLEESIMLATDGETNRVRAVYAAVGAWVDILGSENDMPKVFSQAVSTIRSS